MNLRLPGEGRYAQVEREQRWTVLAVPTAAEFAGEILDRYICETRLRLRRVDTGEHVVFKLAQKVRAAETELAPDETRLTAPPFAVHDVTNDDRYSGGALAFASDDEIDALVSETSAGRDD